MPKRPGRGGPGSEQETVQLAGAVSKGQARDDHLPGPRTRSNARQTDVTNLRPGGRPLSLKTTYRLCSPCKEESVPSTTQPTGRSCVSRPGGRGPGFLSLATHQPPRLPPLRGDQGGAFLFCPLRPGHRKTLPVPPFEGGDLVSVGQQHDSPRVSPLPGGNKGGLSILAAAPCLLPLACCPVSESQSRNPLHLTPQTSSSSANHNASLTSIGKHSASRSYPDVLLVK